MTWRIPLTRGQEAVVSDEDADLMEFKWYAYFNRSYANGGKHVANRCCRIEGKNQNVFMHRVILARTLGRNLTKGEFVDHIDGNPLNNTRENLRLANRSQNGANRGKDRRNSVGLKGVTFDKQSGKYKAQIKFNRQLHYLGLYPTAELAHAAYCKAAREFFGEFANFGASQ